VNKTLAPQVSGILLDRITVEYRHFRTVIKTGRECNIKVLRCLQTIRKHTVMKVVLPAFIILRPY